MSRVALVTGGNRGIGLAIVKDLLSRGYKVAFTYRSSLPDASEFEGAMPVKCDVTDSASVDEAFDEIENALGPVEILIPNAGITKDNLLMRITESQWSDVINTNLNGAFYCVKRASKAMIKARWGRIVFMSSVIGLMGGPGQINYAASKAGLIGMARSITRELGGRGITANVVAPGPVKTEMFESLGDEAAQRLIDLVPAKRACEPSEVAAAIAFLASDDAGYISGAVLPVDGGASMGH